VSFLIRFCDPAFWVLVLWWGIVGSVVGSFLNVVVYRVPLDLNLLRPPSHCPGCKRRIRSRDNVPVLSWLILRGRCRYCHMPISARYPIVEAATALMFAALAAGEYAAAGNNLPLQTDWASQGAAVFWSTKQLAWPLYWLFLYHLLLLTTLFCAGLMEIDGHRLPVRLYLPALLAGLTTAAIAAFTRPGSLWRIWRHAVIGDAMTDLPDAAPLVLGALALAAGGALWACQSIRRRAGLATQSQGHSWLLGFLCLEACLGWQVGPVVFAAAVLLDSVSLPLQLHWPRLRIPASLLLLAAAGVWILGGANLVPA
jgi:leader peptidase (prepilin peptidase)/N-methyltransferase